jgi:hypothetical protein
LATVGGSSRILLASRGLSVKQARVQFPKQLNDAILKPAKHAPHSFLRADLYSNIGPDRPGVHAVSQRKD